MSELPNMLRDRSAAMAPRRDALGLRAADEIERLEARIAELEEQLKSHGPAAVIGGVATDPVPMLKRRGRPPKAR